MKKNRLILTLICFLIVLTGCTADKNVKKNTLFVKGNGNVIEAVCEKLDKDYYDEKELTKWVEDEVASYNREEGKKLKIRQNKVKNKKSYVSISYKSIEDYARFNQVTAFCGTIVEAQKAGFSFAGTFESTSDKPEITAQEINGSSEYKVLILEESLQVVLDKKALYCNKQVKLHKDKKTMDLTADAANLAFIIYK